MTANSAPPKERRMPAGSTTSDHYKTIVDTAPLGVLFVNSLGRIETVNAKLLAILGIAGDGDFQAKEVSSLPQLIDSGIADDVRRCLENQKPTCLERRLRKTDAIVHLRCHLTPVFDEGDGSCGVQAIVEDISESKRVEHQVRKVDKLESIGNFAGGIAHDFSAILWKILSNTELAAAEIPPGHAARYHLEQVADACRRAQELVQEILRFSRRTEQKRKPIRLSAIAQDALRYLEAAIPPDIEIHQHISTTQDTILADVAGINRLLMHLLLNASHAMRDTEGILEISIEDVVLGDEEVSRHGNLVPGQYVILTVMDTGPGIPSKILTRIFDPFFTTKTSDEHTGTGLTIVNAIVNAHDGALTVHSEPGKGAMFHVILPIIAPEPESIKPQPPTKQTQTILTNRLFHYI